METADTYRTLTLAHHLLDNREKAIESLNRAFLLDEEILADRDPMVAGIRSYAERPNTGQIFRTSVTPAVELVVAPAG